jgi:transcriptional regulator with XRE-family HTH domain
MTTGDRKADARRFHGPRLEGLVRDRWRDPRGISGLSQELGVSRATLYSWFKGATSPDTASLARLARLLYLTPSELLTALEGVDMASTVDERITLAAERAVRDYHSIGSEEEERMVGRAAPAWRRAPDALGSPAAPPMRSTPPAPAQALWRRRGREAQLLDVIGKQDVEWCGADDPVGPVALRMYSGDYSQMPVRDRLAWEGMLTAETIARWTAARTARGLGYDEQAPVREVLPYAEDPDNFRVVGRDAPVPAVLGLFDEFAARGKPLAAVLVTATGQPHGDLLGIVTPFDLPKLRAASPT